MYYKVLVLITDGEPNDLEKTIDQIVISSHKAVSIIIISVSQEIQDQAHFKHLENDFLVLKDLQDII